MATYEPKNFLDLDGLKKVFELIKGAIDTNDQALQDKITEIEAKIGNWKNSTDDGFKTIATVILDLQTLVGSESVSKQITDAINELDYTGVTDGTIITQVTQVDGKVEATASNLTSTGKTITIDGLDLDVNIDNATIVKNSDGVLSVDASATAVTGKDAIKVTTNNGKLVELVIDEADDVLTQGESGLLANLELKYTKESSKIELIGKNETVISTIDASDFVADGFLDSVEWKADNSNILVFTWNTTAGKTATEIDLTKYIDTYTNGDGLDLNSKTFSVKIKTGEKYIKVDENGVYSDGIDTAIETECTTVYNSITPISDNDIEAAFNELFD